MPKKDKLILGLCGYGVVGTGLAKTIDENRELIKRRTGKEIIIKTIAVRTVRKNFAYPLPAGVEVVDNLNKIINDPEIDVIVELMGGTDASYSVVKGALNAGKHVVTANKALLAENGLDLFQIAGEKNLYLGYEASVCGGIPIIQTMKESLAGNTILSLSGILNGTCNYILSAMSAKGQSFDVALEKAQELGFAEADPTLDIGGFDAAHKLIILIRIAWGQNYPYDKLSIQGIQDVNIQDITFAKELGYSIKLIGQAKINKDKIEAGVYPMLVKNDMMLAKVEGSYNAVLVEGNAVGSIFMHGRGAGDLPTGSAVLSDIIAIARETKPNNTGFISQKLEQAVIFDLDESENSYYFHLTVQDKPGVMRDVAGVLAENNISIAQAIQKQGEESEIVPLVFMTHKAKNSAMEKAMKTLEEKGLLKSQAICYRVLAHK